MTQLSTPHRPFLYDGLPPGTLPALGAGAVATAALSLAAVAATGLGVVFGITSWLVYAGAAGLILASIGRSHPAASFGLPNLVTLGRLVATALLTGVAVEAAVGGGVAVSALAVAGVAIAAIAADGLDGRIARTRGPATAFGARFDMETDAFLLLALSLFAFATGKAGTAVLLVGLMRYLFVAAAVVLPWMAAPLPPSFRRKLVCVVQGVVLTALAVPFVQPPLSEALAFGALGALVWSFGADVLWLRRNRR